MTVQEENAQIVGTVWTLALDQPAPEVKPLLAARLELAGPEDAASLADAMDAAQYSHILERFKRGRRCFAAWVSDQIGAYCWLSFEEEYVGELNLHLKLLPDEVYIWDCATLPAFRGKRLYTALLAHIIRELRSENIHRIWIGADLVNEASQKGIASAGFQAIADILVVRRDARRLAWMQGRPGASDALVSAARRLFLDHRDQVWLDPL